MEDDTQADDKESKVAMLKYLNREFYEPESVKIEDEDISFGNTHENNTMNFGQGDFNYQDPRP